MQFQSEHPCINDLVYSYIPYMTIPFTRANAQLVFHGFLIAL